MRNSENLEGEPEAVWNVHCGPVVDFKAILKALEKEDQGKDKASNATEEGGGMPRRLLASSSQALWARRRGLRGVM